ncbi:hypothetical protein [Burkholderia puraquae]|nr:hypothetical protein [Burkholderia puraquae]
MIAGLDSIRIQAGDFVWRNDFTLNAVAFPDSLKPALAVSIGRR